jgi:hypothetical protein
LKSITWRFSLRLLPGGARLKEEKMLNEKKILTEILKQWIKDRLLGTALDGAQRFVTTGEP